MVDRYPIHRDRFQYSFNLVIEILMVDRRIYERAEDGLLIRFNLVIEILMVDRIKQSYQSSRLIVFQSRNRDSYG